MSKYNKTQAYKHKITKACHFLNIVLEHATSKDCQVRMNAWAYIIKCVKVTYKWCLTMKEHTRMLCVCVLSLVRDMRSYIYLCRSMKHISLWSWHLAWIVAKTFFVFMYRVEFSTFCQSFIVILVHKGVMVHNPKTDSNSEFGCSNTAEERERVFPWGSRANHLSAPWGSRASHGVVR